MTKWLDLHLVGRGLYGASRQARSRFDTFPPLFADDKFFDSQYDEAEKVVVSEALVMIWTPATLRELLRNETRVAKGNRQLATYLHGVQSVKSAAATAATHVKSGPMTKLRTLKQWTRDIRRSDYAPLITYLSVTGLTRFYLVFLRIRQRQVSWR